MGLRPAPGWIRIHSARAILARATRRRFGNRTVSYHCNLLSRFWPRGRVLKNTQGGYPNSLIMKEPVGDSHSQFVNLITGMLQPE